MVPRHGTNLSRVLFEGTKSRSVVRLTFILCFHNDPSLGRVGGGCLPSRSGPSGSKGVVEHRKVVPTPEIYVVDVVFLIIQ